VSFRARIAIAAAAAVALAVVLASVLVFFVVRDQLRGQIDQTLEERAAKIAPHPLGQGTSAGGEALLSLRPGFGEPNTVVQLVRENGTTLSSIEGVDLPAGTRAVALAAAGEPGESYFSEATVAGVHVRVLTFAFGPGFAVQVARPLTEVDDTLAQVRLYLLLIAGGGVTLAALLGLLVSGAALAPVRRLTETAERVSETGDLSERIEVDGKDELSRLAGSFNAMLAALEDSNRAQRQLVADASHELRTPLTSLRTNIEVLASDRALPAEERGRLLSDVVEQLGEMTTLIAELIELANDATGDLPKLARACVSTEPVAGWERFADLAAGPERPPRVPVAGDDVHRLMYTSGTTGRPKGVMLTHANLAWKNAAHITEFGFTSDDVGLACGPLYHVGALDLVTTTMIAAGATTIIHRMFDAVQVVDEIERSRVTCVWTAPAMVRAILDVPGVAERDLTSVQLIIAGGEKMPIPSIERLRTTFPSAWFADASPNEQQTIASSGSRVR